MPTDRRRERGALGERIAAAHLAERGFQVLERNFRTRFGELDLVLAGEGCIVFCEVKTRVGAGRSGPDRALDAIGYAKRRKLRAMAAQWLRCRPPGASRPLRSRLRFDAVGVTLSPAGAVISVEHVPDAF